MDGVKHMAENKTVYTFEGNADDLIKTIDTLTKFFEKLKIAAKSADKAIDKVDDSSKKGGKSLKKLPGLADNVGKSFSGLERAAQGLGGKTGEMAGKFSALASALPMLANPVGIVVGVLAGLTVGVVAVSGAFLGAVLAADDLAKSLKKFESIEGFEPVPPDAMASIETVNNSVGALAAIFQELVVIVGANVAPVIEEVAVYLVKLGLKATDTFRAFSEGKNLLFEFANFMVKELLNSISAPISMLVKLVHVMGMVAEAAGATGLSKSLLSVHEAYDGFVDGISRSITGGAFSLLGEGLSHLGDKTSDYDERARALIKTVGITDEAIKAHAATVKELLSVWDKLVVGVDKNVDALETLRQANLGQISPQAEARGEYYKTRTALDDLEVSTRQQIQATEDQIAKGKKLGVSEKEMLKLHEARFNALDNLVAIEHQRDAAVELLQRSLIDAAETEQELNEAIRSGEKEQFKYTEALGKRIDQLHKQVALERIRNGTTERYSELLAELEEKIELEKDALKEKAIVEQEAAEKREELREKKKEEDEKEKDKRDKERDEAEKAAKEEQDARIKGFEDMGNAAQAFGDSFGSVIDFIKDKNENLTEGQKRVVAVLFKVQQAASLTSVVMSTAAAVMKALAELGPVAGGIAATAITIEGAIQTAAILSAPPPFHDGGMVYDDGGMVRGGMIPSNDGVLINALPGESVLTREATAALGEDGVNRLNSGGSTGSITINMVYKHKIYDTFVSDNIAKGGPLADAIRGNSRVGRSGALRG